MKIVHIITSMNTGGAERMLSNLCNYDKSNHSHIIISLMDNEIKYNLLSEQSVIKFNFRKSPLVFVEIIKLFRTISKLKPNLIQTWLTHPNLLGLLYKRVVNNNISLIWNIRHGLQTNKSFFNRFLYNLLTKNSSKVDGLIFVSNQSKNDHEAIKFQNKNSIVIPNGFNQIRSERVIDRKELNIPPTSFIIGHVGRYAPVKNQVNIVKSLNNLNELGYDVTLLMIGRGLTSDNTELLKMVKNQYRKKLKLLGEKRELDQYYKMMDIFVLSSHSEGFPNVLGESMINGTPVVTSDSGDSYLIVGECGYKLKENTVEELTTVLEGIMQNNTQLIDLGVRSRKKIIREYGIEMIVKRYISFYEKIYNLS